MKFGEYLKACRIKQQFKLTKASEKLGISPSYISSLENGTRNAPSFALLQKMADMLELDQRERYRLFDLAAENKQPPVLSDDLNAYIYENLIIRELLRYAMECHLTEKEWTHILSFVKKHYHY